MLQCVQFFTCLYRRDTDFMAQSLKIMKELLPVALFSCLLPGLAQAAAITNMQDVPQVMELRVHEGVQTFTIEPGMTWRKIGNVEVRRQGQDRFIYIYNNEEYAIWKNGGPWPQRRINNTRNRL